ncbi:hypothetical protein [Bacillus altitudinis]|nr:hypothetical protein [Bacillus altitudinis]
MTAKKTRLFGACLFCAIDRGDTCPTNHPDVLSVSYVDKNDNNPPKVLYHPLQELTDFHPMTVLYWYKQVQVLLLILCFR